jgi:hypothetical protein
VIPKIKGFCSTARRKVNAILGDPISQKSPDKRIVHLVSVFVIAGSLGLSLVFYLASRHHRALGAVSKGEIYSYTERGCVVVDVRYYKNSVILYAPDRNVNIRADYQIPVGSYVKLLVEKQATEDWTRLRVLDVDRHMYTVLSLVEGACPNPD